MSKKILLVEHSSYEANLTQRILKNLGYQVCHVSAGAAVASQISQFQLKRRCFRAWHLTPVQR